MWEHDGGEEEDGAHVALGSGRGERAASASADAAISECGSNRIGSDRLRLANADPVNARE